MYITHLETAAIKTMPAPLIASATGPRHPQGVFPTLLSPTPLYRRPLFYDARRDSRVAWLIDSGQVLVRPFPSAFGYFAAEGAN
jgi:hypothetical protein